MNAFPGISRRAWQPTLLAVLLIPIFVVTFGVGFAQEEDEKPVDGLISCRILLDNGDRTRVLLDGLTPDFLSWRYIFAPDQRVEVKQGRVKRIEFVDSVAKSDDNEEEKPKKTTPAEDEGDAKTPPKPEKEAPAMWLKLHSETRLRGRFDRLTEDSIFFQPTDSKLIEFPRTEVDRLSRSGKALRNVKAFERSETKHMVITETGAVQGDLVQEGQWLKVKNKGLIAEVAIHAIQGLRFPASEDLNETPEDQLNCQVVLQNEGKVQGMNPWMDATNLTMTVLNGPDIVIPVEQLASINFSMGIPARSNRVLVWGQFADADEEMRRTIQAIQAGFTGWTFTTHDKVPAGDEFREALLASRVLLIPEMESYSDAKLRQKFQIGGERASLETFFDREFAPLLKTYLRRGGRVIICHPDADELALLKRLDLFPEITVAANSEKEEVTFTEAGKALSEGIGKTFMTTDATSFYELQKGAEALATSETGCPVFISRHGKGMAAVVGMDYYERSPQTERVIQNLFTIP